jgi:VWFA-related protein
MKSIIYESGKLLGTGSAMSGRFIAMAAIIGLVLPFGVTAQEPQAPQARFKSSVNVVSVTAVVRDRKGRFVRDLSSRDFVVAESGHAKPILDFREMSDGPVKLGLLVDASGSMRVGRKAVDARQAARHLLGALVGKDEAALFSFDTQLDRVTEFTSDIPSIDASFERLNTPYGQTSLYDAVHDAAKVVTAHGRGEGRLPQRAALVVITDGIDTRSRLTSAQVSAAASAIDVPVYVISVMAPIDDPRVDDTPPMDVEGLTQLARNTGGELFTASAPAHASIAARRIVDELRHQYVLAFEASNANGWRRLEVRARDPKLIVRARTGYSAGASGRPTAH